MWTTAIAWLLSNWRALVIASLIAFGAVQTARLKAEKRDHAATKVEYEVQRRMAQAATDQQKKEYDDALTLAKKSASSMVAAAEKNAYANFLKRYGMACPADRIGPDWVRNVPTTTASAAPAAESSRESHGASGEQLALPAFVDSCGRDAARLNSWIELCKTAKCEVVK
jgi:hypothetical protein